MLNNQPIAPIVRHVLQTPAPDNVEVHSFETRMTLIDGDTRIRIEEFENDVLIKTTLSINQKWIAELKKQLEK